MDELTYHLPRSHCRRRLSTEAHGENLTGRVVVDGRRVERETVKTTGRVSSSRAQEAASEVGSKLRVQWRMPTQAACDAGRLEVMPSLTVPAA